MSEHDRIPGRAGTFVLAATLVLAALASTGASADDVARGDAAWRSRADGERGGRPRSGPIFDAVGFYQRALRARPDDLDARWKLLRALHFAGDFAVPGERDRRAIFERALAVSEDGLERLASRTGFTRLEELDADAIAGRLAANELAPAAVARLYFWSAINWGAWSQTVGLLSAVREGVADRLHRYALVAIALEPDYHDGGGFRLLGRLHAVLPRIPLLSGWVDREKALPLVERAHALAPENPGNRLLLALTLLDLAPGRRDEALELLDELRRLRARPSMRIEDLAMRRLARDQLDEYRGRGAS